MPLQCRAMSDLIRILAQIEAGDPAAAEQLLPLVYSELRRLAAAKLAHEKPGQTLEATALVHEAYLRLVGDRAASNWESRGHFFAAAAEAMRRILVEGARRKKRLKHGGQLHRQEFDDVDVAAPEIREDLLALDSALEKLAGVNASAAEIVQLRYFAGLTGREAAQAMNISPRSADRLWAYARAWLHQEIGPASTSD
jgi:RNA polymerase sigma factor (TIGR02999 family)